MSNTQPLSTAEVAEIEARWSRTTSGPWIDQDDRHIWSKALSTWNGERFADDPVAFVSSDSNRLALTNAPTDIARLRSPRRLGGRRDRAAEGGIGKHCRNTNDATVAALRVSGQCSATRAD